jgi:tRNA(adenine34) deaminase
MKNFSFDSGLRDARTMRQALAEASKAAARGEVPVGAVVVCDQQIVGRGHNQREKLRSPLAHAEILAIEQASRYLGRWRLDDCELYVTLEPCVMCVGAVTQARMKRLVFGCLDPKSGAAESLYQLCNDARLNHRLPVAGGMLAEDCAAILEQFFSRLRQSKRKPTNAERWPSPVEGA